MKKWTKIALAALSVGGVAGGGYWVYEKSQHGTNPLSGVENTLGLSSSGGKANAAGQTVALQAPSTAVVGGTATVVAQPSGFASPVYQFWVHPPTSALNSSAYAGYGDQNGWVQVYGYTASSGYGPANSVNVPTPVAGSYEVIVFAREASAPVHETGSQQGQYEANSATITIVAS